MNGIRVGEAVRLIWLGVFCFFLSANIYSKPVSKPVSKSVSNEIIIHHNGSFYPVIVSKTSMLNDIRKDLAFQSGIPKAEQILFNACGAVLQENRSILSQLPANGMCKILTLEKVASRIVTITDTAGRSHEIKVNALMELSQLKQLASQYLHIAESRQRIYIHGTDSILNDKKAVLEQLGTASVLYVEMMPLEQKNIVVHNLDREDYFSIPISYSMTVDDVKSVISQVGNVSSYNQKLYFQDSLLNDSSLRQILRDHAMIEMKVSA